MLLVIVLILLIVALAYGGIAWSPLLWILFVILIVFLVVDLIGITDASTGVRRRRW